MSNPNLSKKEKDLRDAFERGELVRVKDFASKKRQYESIARRTLSKPKNINIRLSERDLHRLKVIAAEKGLPYQTFISSLLHQRASKDYGAREDVIDSHL